MIFGYVRISTNKESQKTDRQLITLRNYSEDNNFIFDRIFEERISGTVKAENRPQYDELKKQLRKDDIIVITDIDRLGRSADDVMMELKILKSKRIKVVALDVPHMNEWNTINDTSLYDMIIDIVITLKAHMAQQEREKTVSRINQGLLVARQKGTVLGRPKVSLPKDFIKEYNKFKNGDYGKISAKGFAKMLGIGRSTLYKYISIYEEM
ncbi:MULTISPECIES: recombinase family protein [Clostridium]|uniref:Recombinase n=2 Tax=Clostridium intestinale TaxID=36845 RepID=U2Q8Q0_9CLOT|nr:MULTISPECIES: recombinase family protein [Clostridium]ERK32544.1 recombinase [Clostridium intestinale URNW]QLY79461.1 recombinase family protein [Clostridium intestinale]